jgi:radical SAM protein with 4Fe4S-binding SPASM domain
LAGEVPPAIEAKPLQKPSYQCGGGRELCFAIDPYGQLSICVLSEAQKYDIRAGGFRDGWQGFLHQQRLRKITRPTKCVACTLKAVCGMCPANGELESGDPRDAGRLVVPDRASSRHGARDPESRRTATASTCPGGSGHERLASAASRLRLGTPTIDRLPQTIEKDGNVLPARPSNVPATPAVDPADLIDRFDEEVNETWTRPPRTRSRTTRTRNAKPQIQEVPLRPDEAVLEAARQGACRDRPRAAAPCLPPASATTS